MTCIKKIQNTEVFGSKFSSRTLTTAGDISGYSFKAVVKNIIQGKILEIPGIKNAGTINFDFSQLQTLKKSTYQIEYWGDFGALGNEPFLLEELSIVSAENATNCANSDNLNFEIKIEEISIPVNITKAINNFSLNIESLTPEQIAQLKGDAFTYADFTPTQIAELQKPATDKLVELNELETALTTSERLRVQNENTRISNEEIRTTNETDRISYENSRQENEVSRIENENGRVLAETERNDTETVRSSNENTRISSENTRNTNEQSRVNAEKNRVTAENSRTSAETNRVTAETSRNTNENTRISSENSRVSAETNRATAETSRASAETTRVNSENTRISNENNRISAENSRVTSESARVTAENARVAAENERVAAENARKAALDLKQDKLQDTTRNIGVGKSDASATEKLDVNGKIKDSQGILKAQRTITITGNTTLSETHNGAVLNVTNTCTITIPTGLDANFQCVVFAKGSVIVTFVNGGVTVYAPSGLLLKTDKMASLICTSTNNYNLTGELATS